MTPWIRFVLCALAAVCALAGCPTSGIARQSPEDEPELPLARAHCTLAPDGKARFLSSLRVYADQGAFAMRVSRSSPEETGMLIQMYREDLKLIGTNPFNANEYSFGMYSNDGPATSEAEARDALRALVNVAEGAACAMRS